MSRLLSFAALLLLSISTHVWAAQDPLKITAKEKAACTADAIKFCAYTYPDETKLIGCMKSNRSSLSPVCLVAFDAGLRRRHLN